MAVAILFLLACAVPASVTQEYTCQINRPRVDCGEPLCQSQLHYHVVYKNLRTKISIVHATPISSIDLEPIAVSLCHYMYLYSYITTQYNMSCVERLMVHNRMTPCGLVLEIVPPCSKEVKSSCCKCLEEKRIHARLVFYPCNKAHALAV